MKLIGAKKMYSMPKGTIYVRFWMDNDNQCYELMENFKNGKIKIDPSDLDIYLNNLWALSYEESVKKNQPTYYDENVLGDADPVNTLYIVFDNIDDVVKHVKNIDIVKLNSLQREVINDFDYYEYHPEERKKDIATLNRYVRKYGSKILKCELEEAR